MDLSNLLKDVKAEENVGGLIKPGNYNVIIEKIETKDTKTNGKALNFWLKIFGESYNNKMIFDFINIQNQSEQATQIGLSRLKRISELCGTCDLNQMLGKKMTCYIGVQKSKDPQYGDKETVKTYNEYVAGNNGDAYKVSNDAKFSSDDIPF